MDEMWSDEKMRVILASLHCSHRQDHLQGDEHDPPDPIPVWQALWLEGRLRQTGEATICDCEGSLPHWIMEYLMDAAEKIVHLANEYPPDEAIKQLPVALGFYSGTERFNAFSHYRRKIKEMQFHAAYREAIARGDKVEAFVHEFTRSHGISRATAFRWKERVDKSLKESAMAILKAARAAEG